MVYSCSRSRSRCSRIACSRKLCYILFVTLCKNHGELQNSFFTIRKNGYVPNVCTICEREASKNRRNARYANPEIKKKIKKQNENYRKEHAISLAQKTKNKYAKS